MCLMPNFTFFLSVSFFVFFFIQTVVKVLLLFIYLFIWLVIFFFFCCCRHFASIHVVKWNIRKNSFTYVFDGVNFYSTEKYSKHYNVCVFKKRSKTRRYIEKWYRMKRKKKNCRWSLCALVCYFFWCWFCWISAKCIWSIADSFNL